MPRHWLFTSRASSISHAPILEGFDAVLCRSAVDRFTDVEKWTVLQDKVLK